jgi:hypothetical protein
MANQQLVQTGDPAFDKFANELEIEDETPPGVDAQVAGDDVEVPETPEPSDGETPPEPATPETGDETPQPSAAADDGPPPPSESAAAPVTPDPEREAERERLHQAEQQVEQFRQQQERQRQDEWERETVAAYENQGVPPETARQIARQQRSLYEQSQLAQRQVEIARMNEQGRFNAALHYGTQYGVDPKVLYSYESPKAMEEKAKDLHRIANLEAEVNKIKTAQVPPGQKFDNGRSTPAPRDDFDSNLERYNMGARDEKAEAAAKKATGL